MPSKPAILGQAHSSHVVVPTSAEDLTETGPGLSSGFFVCGRANSHSAWKGRRSHVLAHQKHKGPSHATCSKTAPCPSANVALFLAPIGVRFFAGASAPL